MTKEGFPMTITMTAKHQVTIPRKIAGILSLKKGTMFDVIVHRNRIELIPLETVERTFTDQEYEQLDALSAAERGQEKRVTNAFLRALNAA
jgi:bifunctional DNA-binding transcriptional regulator/antitoxin component of YhaV-PrlF toxin-antitoxin module